MKRLVLAVVLALAPLGATAQVRVPVPPPLGPFSIAMRPEAARAAVPGVEWQVVHDEDLQRGSMRTTSPAIELHGVPFRVLLAYSTNAVFVVRLDAELPLEYAECAARHRAIVEAEASRRDGLTRGPYWHRFYQEPDAPSGVMENGEFVPAPSFSARGEFVIISEPNAPIVGISTYLAPDYGQAFFASGSRDIQINAASFARQGAPVCEIALQMTLSGVNGEFVSSGPEGAQRLAERLAAAEFVRSVTDLVTPDPMEAPRFFPSLAMRDRVEGQATLNCLVLADGWLDCAVREETPAGYEFGLSATRIMRGRRVNVFEGDVAGKRTEFTINFRQPS